jgi:hypothetical protein
MLESERLSTWTPVPAPPPAAGEWTAGRLHALRVASDALAAARSAEEAVSEVVGAGCRALRAGAGGIWRLHIGGGAALDLITAQGPGAAAFEQYRHISLAPDQERWPLVLCALRAKPIWVRATDTAPAGVCLPVLFKHRCLAVMVFVLREGHAIDRADSDFLAVLVNLCAQAFQLTPREVVATIAGDARS